MLSCGKDLPPHPTTIGPPSLCCSDAADVLTPAQRPLSQSTTGAPAAPCQSLSRSMCVAGRPESTWEVSHSLPWPTCTGREVCNRLAEPGAQPALYCAWAASYFSAALMAAHAPPLPKAAPALARLEANSCSPAGQSRQKTNWPGERPRLNKPQELAAAAREERKKGLTLEPATKASQARRVCSSQLEGSYTSSLPAMSSAAQRSAAQRSAAQRCIHGQAKRMQCAGSRHTPL